MKRQWLFWAVILLLSLPVLAQSIPTSTISGKVTADGNPLPGVTVSASSPNLQGIRTAVTSEAGDYLIPLLPPGSYTIQYELAGMQTMTKKPVLAAGLTERIDVDLRPAAVAEAITVTADSPMTAAVESTQVSTNFNQELIEQLPVARTLAGITLLAPGVNSNGPGNNIIISGAMSFDSLYLVNGVIVNENLRGQPHNLFIEDAIQETTVLTGGISAEFGHFTGGVVNTLTKSGGNQFSGSLRSTLNNEEWVAKTPLTTDQADKINSVYEGTLGGPVFRDRLWFFGAGRLAETSDIRQTVLGLSRQGDQDANGVQIPIGAQLAPVTYPHGTDETRLEGKITGSLTAKHTVIGSFLDVDASETNQTGQVIMDLDSLVEERETPNSLFALNYNGVFTDRFFVEAQYSKKDFKFVGSGSPFYDNIKGTLITDRARATRYWSPTFRATPEGEERDIRVYTAKGTYFLSTPRFGSHEVAAGYEDFNEVRAVNNYQNGSDYRISVASTIVRNGVIYPRMPGGTGGLTRISWLPIFVLSEGSDYTTRSVYLNDRWTLNNHWSFNAGVRYDKNDTISGAGTFQIADDSSINPRLAAHYDLFANGKIIFNASYGTYVGRLSEGAANDADPAGRNASLQWNYMGPNINNDVNAPTSSLIGTEEAIRRVMDWFFQNGGTGRRPFRTTPSVPGVESILDVDGLKSPMVKEYTIGVGSAMGSRGYARADVIYRNWDNFYTSFRDLATGQVTDTRFGTGATYDLSIIRSDSEIYDREYTAVQTQFNYRLLERLRVGGTYTWSRLVGNVTGEDTGSGPLVGIAGEYPEYRRESWNYPTGYLTGDQRHRLRLWAGYDVPTSFGAFNISLLQHFDSGTRTSIDADIDSRPYVTNPGYLTPPGTVTYFFGGRGAIKAGNITRTDLAINYKLGLVRGIELFIQPEVINLFNEQGVQTFNEEVLTAVDCAPQTTGNLAAPCPAKGLQPFNPFTEKPVEGVNYIKGPNFGKADSEADYQTPRTFRVSVGLRF
ncbi:MAG TPA: TonB-dependent receptor [Thermoanaerobaculia bacterium]|nr:TonB-dependent receptor [Thermoanaerobaculia bacterium]